MKKERMVKKARRMKKMVGSVGISQTFILIFNNDDYDDDDDGYHYEGNDDHHILTFKFSDYG